MAGGMRERPQAEGRDPRRLVDAGAAGRHHDGRDMDYDSIAKAGSMLGSGAVIVMDETRCMVRALLRLSYFYYEESCGQCTPCREGTGWLYRMVHRIEHGAGPAGRPRPAELGRRQHPGPHDLRAGRRGGDAGARFIKHFRDEFQYHIEHKRCLVARATPRHGLTQRRLREH